MAQTLTGIEETAGRMNTGDLKAADNHYPGPVDGVANFFDIHDPAVLGPLNFLLEMGIAGGAIGFVGHEVLSIGNADLAGALPAGPVIEQNFGINGVEIQPAAAPGAIQPQAPAASMPTAAPGLNGP